MTLRTFTLGTLALGFVAAGLNHFLTPRPYLAMMPPWVPEPQKVNLVAGAAEIAGGVGLLIPALRRTAGWGLLVLLVAVFPANVQAARHGWPGMHVPAWALWARLPVQPLLLAVVWWAAMRRPEKADTALDLH
ncbi:MAG: DoxX family protein [Hymenobacteraceae bacterium]|nr:DoxX family protein [Hymenobacteraceae bacterium]